METRALLLHALTPVHVGTGRGEGIIDLPIARDCVTGTPLIPGSGVKGPIRAAAGEDDQAFGGKPGGADLASALRFSDARLVAMPVRSDHGTFAWVTSPLVLARLCRDIGAIVDLPAPPHPPPAGSARCTPEAAVRHGGQLVLDRRPFQATDLEDWPDRLAELVFPSDPVWRSMFRARLVVVTDGAFDAFAQSGTDVRPHIRMDTETGTVQAGALWYEESVPPDAVFAGVVQSVGNREKTAAAALAELTKLLGEPLTVGGGKTTGMGRMRAHLHGGEG